MSKVCPQCGKELTDNAKFCNQCGAKMDSVSQHNTSYESTQTTYGYAKNSQQNNNTIGNTMNGKSALIIDSSETVKGELKNSVALNFFIGGGLAKSRVFFTDKRVYYQGKRFSFRSFGINTSDFVVDLKDISATRIVHKNPIVFLIVAIIVCLCISVSVIQETAIGGIFLILLLLAIVAFIYSTMKDTYIAIFFPGGSVRLSVKMYSYQDILSFHKSLRRNINEL